MHTMLMPVRGVAAPMPGEPGDGVLELAVRPGLVLRVLLGCLLALAVAGAAVAAATVRLGRPPSLYGLAALFDLDREATVPAMFSCLMLLLAARLLAVLARESARRGRGWRLHWNLLALGFAGLVLDEGAGVHELLNRPVRELLRAPGFATAWLAAAAVPLATLVALYLPFLRALPRRHAGLFLGSGLLFLLGAVALEAVAGEIIERHGKARCTVLRCGGTVDHHAAREALWARFSTAAPRRRRRFVARSKLVKRA
jgi:hypothetical protein